MFLLTFYLILFSLNKSELVLCSLMIRTRSYFKSNFDEIKLLVIVSLFKQLVCFDEVIIAPTDTNIELTLKLSNKRFSLVNITVENEFMFLFGIGDRSINKLNKKRKIILIFWHFFLYFKINRLPLFWFWLRDTLRINFQSKL